MHTQETLIEKLASIDLASDFIDQIKELVVGARVIIAGEGPKTRDANKIDRADDYQAVVQVSVAIGYDGKLHTLHRTDCPDHAIIPMMAAIRHTVNEITKKNAEGIGLSVEDAKELIDPIIRACEGEDFEAHWQTAKTLIESKGGKS